MKPTIFLITLLSCFFINNGWAQYTAVPDPIFEQYLIDEGIDSEGVLDGQFLTADALGVEEVLIDNLPISNMAGIEAFVDMIRLDARNNNFTTIDLSQNLNLSQLTIIGPLNNIDLSNNVNLHTLLLSDCDLTTIDLSNNINIANLGLRNNHFSSLDLSNNINLWGLWLSGNNFSSIDLSSNVNLVGLHVQENKLTSIDVSNLGLLSSFEIFENELTQIDVSNNTQLSKLSCGNNFLTQLDFTNNPEIRIVYAPFNQLTEILFGNTSNMVALDFTYNQLTEMDTSNMPLLVYFGLGFNLFTTVDVSQNPLLEIFYCLNNPIDAPLDLYSNHNLRLLHCRNTLIPSIDVTQCPELNIIDFQNTLVTNIDFSNNPLLEQVYCGTSNNLESVDVRNGNNDILFLYGHSSPNFKCIMVDDASSGDGTFSIDPQTTLVNNEAECEALAVQDYLQAFGSIYPNPVKDILNIDIGEYAILNVKIVDVLGRELLSKKGDIKQLDVSYLPSGLLFVRIETAKGLLTKKIIKK